MAFVVDIRRGNLLLHLTYKALIEVARDRTDFMSRVFARQAPAGVGFRSTARALFDAFGSVPVSSELAATTLHEIFDRLEHTHGFPLSDDDRRGITEVYRSLYTGGPNVRGDFGGGRWIPSYAELMAQTDLHGYDHSFMESEANFRILKEYESNNLIVPLVGDFAGPKTIRAVGRYVKDHHATVTTFYTSNVEEYLFRARARQPFSRTFNASLNQDSTFIRAFFTHTDAGLRSLLDPMRPCLAAVARKVRTYTDLISRSKAPTP